MIRSQEEVRAELARVEQQLTGSTRLRASHAAALVSRQETLRWVLGIDSLFADDEPPADES